MMSETKILPVSAKHKWGGGIREADDGGALREGPSTTTAAPWRSPSPFVLRKNGEDLNNG